DRIILGATAEDLNDALDFVFAPYERIQRALGSRLREVAAEFREERSFLWPRCRCFFAGRARELFPQRGQTQTALHQNFRAEALLFAEHTEQKMFGLDIRAAILAGFVSCKKYDASRFLCITFEHVSSLLPLGPRSLKPQPREFAERHVPAPVCGRTGRRAPGCVSQSATSTCACDAIVVATRTQPKHSARPNLR